LEPFKAPTQQRNLDEDVTGEAARIKNLEEEEGEQFVLKIEKLTKVISKLKCRNFYKFREYETHILVGPPGT